ncbi:hypothetical protein CALVIDRAFT_598699 [Calocera viscosa TUFC12733]|uniref:Uncharacterized protein n=1 Tax=Calocera viscosa (strain TUFC12733) TaxID=1330018 RepID=A0A167LT38_CALVF|nr:hypothetical protein CALVIDRAFT_598699 [Calocera viscosa TUFC12733]
MAPVFVLSPPSPALTTDRRTPSGNWVLQATPAPTPSHDEKLNFWGYSDMMEYMLSDPSRRKQYADPASIEAGALELGLPSPLPEYCHEADEPNEPDTIAKKLFIFGFMFPLLWLVGACILCIPLRAYPLPEAPSETSTTSLSPSDAPAYSKDPRPANLDTVWTQSLVDLYSRAERHWAWRCIWAMCALVLIAVTVVCALVGTQLI